MRFPSSVTWTRYGIIELGFLRGISKMYLQSDKFSDPVKVHFTLEQPGSSTQFGFQCLFNLLELLGWRPFLRSWALFYLTLKLFFSSFLVGNCSKVVFGIWKKPRKMKCFGHWMVKPTILITTLQEGASCLQRKWGPKIAAEFRESTLSKVSAQPWFKLKQFAFAKRHWVNFKRQ